MIVVRAVRVALFTAVAALLVTHQPVLSAVGRPAASDPEATYQLRLERGRSHRVRFHMIEPRGDSLIEAERIDLILTPRGLVVRPVAPTVVSSPRGANLTFESFELFLPTDGSAPLMEGAITR